MKRVLITGGAGFLGHHIVQYVLEKTDWDIMVLDRLDLSGNLNRIGEVLAEMAQKMSNEEAKALFKRVKFEWWDLKAPVTPQMAKRLGTFDYILHLAASSHVDRSIEDPLSFVMDNVVGTTNLLVWAKGSAKRWEDSTDAGLNKGGVFINFSTDEVFGPAPDGYAHKENDAHYPSNPYSASKSGQEAIGYAFFITYGLPVITTHTMNNFGERQHPEKLVPRTISNVINGKPQPIFAELDKHGQLQAVGSRFWIHCRNTASALLFILEKGVAGEAYNIIGFDELTNLRIAEKVAEYVGKPLIPDFVDFHKTRPGHDRRYALDGKKLSDMGWVPEMSFEESLKRTVDFTVSHPQWQ